MSDPMNDGRKACQAFDEMLIRYVDGEATESGDAFLAAAKGVSGQPNTLDVVREGVRVTLEARPKPVVEKKAQPEKE